MPPMGDVNACVKPRQSVMEPISLGVARKSSDMYLYIAGRIASSAFSKIPVRLITAALVARIRRKDIF